MLLDAGVDFNDLRGYFSNASAAPRYLDIVKKLLHQGADVNAQGGYYGNSLQAATIGGHQDIVQLLLDAEADLRQ
ncbi:hypothetical protein CTA1_10836 [Colletotrichum tanaceti]|uniref:Uncharacterized protein n=1 Tax=Colletotrichum tanaceti TaxID=1306861 RepID=A0A4U6X3J7_9PEZI|nr:hypothetical protein CTA1_10836 [Colletotrichum tanaceti]